MDMLYELKRSLVRLSKAPGFSALAIFVIAIGLGLSLFIMTFLNVIFFNKFDFPDAEKLVYITRYENNQIVCCHTTDSYTYQYLKSHQDSFESIGGLKLLKWVNLTNGKNSARPWTAYTTASLFDTLQIKPILGRTLQAEDDISGAPKVAVLSYKLWQEVFAGDANAIGAMVKVQGENYTVVGVMPKGFMFPVQHELWLPLQLEYVSAPPEGLNSSNVFMFGRMRANESIDSADTAMRNLTGQIASEFPDTYHPKGEIASWPMNRLFFQSDDKLIFLMSGAAIAILLLVIFNVGNMLLARANESIREIAIKSALGVPRFALMQQTLSESFILCVVGAVFGVIFAYAGLQITEANMQVITSFPPPFWWEFDIQFKDLLIITAVTLATWLATGIIPAWRASGVDCINVLKDSNKGGSSKVNNKLAHLLVCLQIAISSILIAMALSTAIKLSRMLVVDYGTETDNYITGHVILPVVDYPTREARLYYFDELHRQLKGQSGIDTASSASHLVGEASWEQVNFNLSDRDLTAAEELPKQPVITVDKDYFEVLGVKLLDGRFFEASDTESAPQVVIVSDEFAKKMWPNESALGKQIQINPKTDGEWLTVVGVIPQILQTWRGDTNINKTVFYRPYTQALAVDESVYKFVAKYRGDVASVEQQVMDAARQTDLQVSADAIWTLTFRLGTDLNYDKLFAKLFAVFGLLSLVLASSAIYSVCARAVNSRIVEFGIRRALGVPNSTIVGNILGRGALQLLIGLSIGLVASLIIAINTASGVEIDSWQITKDAIQSFIFASIVLCFTIFVANIFPARKAVALEPADALRYE